MPYGLCEGQAWTTCDSRMFAPIMLACTTLYAVLSLALLLCYVIDYAILYCKILDQLSWKAGPKPGVEAWAETWDYHATIHLPRDQRVSGHGLHLASVPLTMASRA